MGHVEVSRLTLKYLRFWWGFDLRRMRGIYSHNENEFQARFNWIACCVNLEFIESTDT